MQGAKKFENGLWFVKEMRLDSDTWKTQVKFDFAEKNEIGIIEDISVFDEGQRELINNELSQRYFCPSITEIKSVTEKFGNFYFDVMIGDYKKNFTVKNLTKNVRYHGDGFDIIDVDGNRYRIDDYNAISKKSRRKIAPYLY